MELVSLAGVILGGLVLYFGVAKGGGIGVFLNFDAFVIVVGGTLASIMIGTPWQNIVRASRACVSIFLSMDRTSPADILSVMVELSKTAHKSGFASIMNESKKYRIKFLNRAVKLASSGIDSENLRKVLEKEVIESRESQNEAANIFRTMGVFSPMFGLVGTIVGIIRLLDQLTNVEAIGPSMAIAIVTTFYGIFLANLFYVPIANKIRLKSIEETIKNEMITEGLLAIKAGDVPYVIKNHLESFVDRRIEVKVA